MRRVMTKHKTIDLTDRPTSCSWEWKHFRASFSNNIRQEHALFSSNKRIAFLYTMQGRNIAAFCSISCKTFQTFMLQNYFERYLHLGGRKMRVVNAWSLLFLCFMIAISFPFQSLHYTRIWITIEDTPAVEKNHIKCIVKCVMGFYSSCEKVT